MWANCSHQFYGWKVLLTVDWIFDWSKIISEGQIVYKKASLNQ
jgi:hypothetical protein